jgi:hypothetical protein
MRSERRGPREGAAGDAQSVRVAALDLSAEDFSPRDSVGEERVSAHIHAVISHFLDALQIPESSVTRPTVLLRVLDTSYYLGATNQIHIAFHHEGMFSVYGEEVLHWLRFHMKPPSKGSFLALPADRQSAVDEFFGYLGFNLARQVCAGYEVASAASSDPEATSSDVVREYRKRMTELENDLTSLRRFNRSETPISLRSIQGYFDELLVLTESSDRCAVEDVRCWFHRGRGLLAEISEAPRFTEINDEGMQLLERRLFSGVREFTAKLERRLVHEAGDSHVISQASASGGGVFLQQYRADAARLSELISDYFDELLNLKGQLTERYESLFDHCDGYEAAVVFLQNCPAPLDVLKELLATSCRKVYFDHVFGSRLDLKRRPCSLAQWGEALRMGIRHFT